MLGEFSGQHESDGSLNFSRRQCCLLVVGSQLSGFRGNSFEDIIDERVHDGHSLFGDPRVGVDLLEDLVNVRGVRFRSLFGLSAAAGLFGRRGLLGGFASGLGGCLGHGGN